MLALADSPTTTPPAPDDTVAELRAHRSQLIALLHRVDALRERIVARVRRVDARLRETRQGDPRA